MVTAMTVHILFSASSHTRLRASVVEIARGKVSQEKVRVCDDARSGRGGGG